MPLIRLDIIEGKKEKEILSILDVIHESAVKALDIPDSDRYQIVTQHKPYEMVIDDTGLGLDRTKDVMVISVTSNKRDEEKKIRLYKFITENLEEKCNISKENVMINVVENTSADWSFGNGVAQFLTGDL